MGYQTSFYMNIASYSRLAKAAQRTGMSMKGLIIQMMYNYARDHKKMKVEEGTVQYQRVDRKENWTLFRVVLAKKDYELFTDMRKVMKKSVSLLVALAIKKYLDKILTKILKKTINYTSLIYDSLGIRWGKCKTWILHWKLIRRPTTKTHSRAG